MALALILIKGTVLYVLGRAFGLRKRGQWLFTLGLAQAGEFGFVLISFALQQSVLTTALGNRLLLVIALTMLITPLLFLLYDWLSKKMGDSGVAPREPDEIDDEGATCRTKGDAPEIDGNLFIDTGFESLTPGDIVRVTVDEASDYDLWGHM